jgi:hypothetical protein
MRTLLIALLLLAPACDNDDTDTDTDADTDTDTDSDSDTDTDSDSDTDTDSDTGPFTAPSSGTWFYDEGTATTDTCSLASTGVQGDGNFELADNGNGTFTVTPSDGTDPFTCTLTGRDFTCAERFVWDEDYSGSGFDAVLSVLATAQGTFASETSMSGTQAATGTCTGTQCALAAAFLGVTFPCSLVVEFTATKI